MSDEKSFKVTMERKEGFVFNVDFNLEDVPNLIMDEPEPVGEGSGPNASKLLAACLGNCLSASLLFCLQKARLDVKNMITTASGTMKRNKDGRWRISEVFIKINISSEKEASPFDRCIDIFKDYCIISESVKNGIPIKVEVKKL
jgi:organic hydroperoxide reductase OsmC/OhrA